MAEVDSAGHRLSSGVTILSPLVSQIWGYRSSIPPISQPLKDVVQNIIGILNKGTDNDGWRRVSKNNSGNTVMNVPSSHDNRYSKNFRNHADNMSSGNKNNYRYLNTGRNHNSGSAVPQYDFRRNNSAPHGGGGASNSHSHSQHHHPLTSNITSTSSPSSMSTPTQQSFHHTYESKKYTSRFKTKEQNMDTTILNTVILGKLNKFSPANYSEIKEFLEQILDSGQTDFLKSFMHLVFEKAASEKNFCPLYARLLGELSSNYKILLEEMTILYEKYCNIFKEIAEETVKEYVEFVKLNDEKKYRLGYSLFISELLPYEVVNEEVFLKVVDTIIENIDYLVKTPNKQNIIDEYADCLATILKAIPIEQSESIVIESVKTTLRLDKTLTRLAQYTVKNPENISLTAKARFALLDILEQFGKDFM